MKVQEARNKYGYHAPGYWRDGYVNCNRCPLDGDNCSLKSGEILGKSPTGYTECWEYIAKVMTEREAENTKRETASAVEHPSQYAGEKYECIEVMLEVFGVEFTKAFCLGNAFKYLWRCGKKHRTPYEDIAKAMWYLEKYQSLVKGEKENDTGRMETDTGV